MSKDAAEYIDQLEIWLEKCLIEFNLDMYEVNCEQKAYEQIHKQSYRGMYTDRQGTITDHVQADQTSLI